MFYVIFPFSTYISVRHYIRSVDNFFVGGDGLIALSFGHVRERVWEWMLNLFSARVVIQKL